MPTGPLHVKITRDPDPRSDGILDQDDCRCTIGTDHDSTGAELDDDESDYVNQGLDVHDAADIWRSNGMDEDYRFGYSDDELRAAADSD